MKILIGGTRDFTDYALLKREVGIIIEENKIKDPEIVSGCARGADSLAIKYANEMGFKLHKFPADWTNLGKKAGPLRNIKMGEFIKNDGIVVLFWNGYSKGTKHMLDVSRNHNIPTYIIYY